MKFYNIIKFLVVISLMLNIPSYYSVSSEEEVKTWSFTPTNFKYTKSYTANDFDLFLKGENPTLIEGYPELLYDDTILSGIYEIVNFYKTETAYYLLTKQPSKGYVMYRFQQIGDYITQYNKYDYIRS